MTNEQLNQINPKKLDQLIHEVISEFGGEAAITDAIRKEKAFLIDDIMRSFKIAQLHTPKLAEHIRPENLSETFDKLYELNLDVLEAYLKGLDKANTEYMRKQFDAFKGQNNSL